MIKFFEKARLFAIFAGLSVLIGSLFAHNMLNPCIARAMQLHCEPGVDNHLPEIHMFSINHGAGNASLHEVTLQLDATDTSTAQDELQVRYANNGQEWGPWAAYQANREWLLNGGDGEKIVLVEVKNKAGKTAMASASIYLYVPVTFVELNRTSLTLATGDDPVILTAKVLPEDATNQQVRWHSSDPGVAGIKDGIVTPLSEGDARITVTTTDGGFTATCRVKVISAVSLYGHTVDHGDVTGSGVVNWEDVNLILGYIVEKDTLDERQQNAADVNLNDTVEVSDAIIILKYMAGLVPGLPVTSGDGNSPPGASVIISDRLLHARYLIHLTARVNVAELNVREGPGTGYDEIGKVYLGQRFIIREEAHTDHSEYPLWYRINYYGQPGWIAANFVISSSVLYGLDYWNNETRLAEAPEELQPGEYKIDSSYGFHIKVGDNFVPTGVTFYFLEQIPYAILPLERPADPLVTVELLAQGAENHRSNSPFPEIAGSFMKAQELWGVNVLYLMAHAALESAWGTSKIAQEKNNIYGYMAFDDDPYGHAATFRSMEDCILQVSGFIRQAYLSEGGRWYHGCHLVGMNEKYATDPMWAVKIARIMQGLLSCNSYTPVEKHFNHGEVTASSLNLRSGPGINYEVTDTLAQGTPLEVEGMKLAGDIPWLKVSTGSLTGWSSGNYISLLTKPRGVVYFANWYQEGNENQTLNVRNGPGLEYSIEDNLAFGSQFNIERLQPAYDMTAQRWFVWYRISYPGSGDNERWVRGDYVVVDW